MKRFQRLFFFGGFLIFLGFLASCQSEIDRDLTAVNELKKSLPEDVNKLDIQQLPSNADSILESFIKKYPKHMESEFLCFQLVNITRETRRNGKVEVGSVGRFLFEELSKQQGQKT